MSRPDDELPELILPRPRATRLVLPQHLIDAQRLQGQLLIPSLGIYVDSPDSLPVLRSRLGMLPIEEFLAASSAVSWYLAGPKRQELLDAMERQGWDTAISLRDYQLAFAVAMLLDSWDQPGERTWLAEDHVAKLTAVHEITRLVNGVLTDAGRNVDNIPQPDRAGVILMRVANQQFGEFEEHLRPFLRNFLLLRRFARRMENRRRVYLDDVLQEKCGLDLGEWFALAFGLYAFLIQHDGPKLFKRDFLGPSPDLPGITAERMALLIEVLSLDYEGFRRELRSNTYGRQPGYELFNLNPLLQHPVIHTESDSYVVPVAGFYRRRVTSGLVFDLLNSGPNRGVVGEILGDAVELYVERLLNDLPGDGRLVKLAEVSGEKRCDFAYIEGDAAVLIECKRKSLTQSPRTTGLRQHIKDCIAEDRGVADGIGQLLATAQAVQAGRVSEVPAGSRLILVLVTLDPFYWANTSYIRSVIDEVLDENRVGQTGFDWQVCPVPDLEEVCGLLASSKGSLVDLLIRKVDDPDHRTWDMTQWIRTVPRQEWEAAGGELQPLPCHEELRKVWTAEVYERFRDPASS